MNGPAQQGTLNPPTDPRSGDAFQAACRRHDIIDLQDALRSMTKRDAVDHLQALFPHQGREWHRRHLPRLMAVDGEALTHLLAYADPTGEAAVENVLAARTAA